MRTNNKGLSLVEMVIVVAIMSVLAAVMTVGLSSVISKPAEECAQKIANSLRDAKVATMGKRFYYVDISQNSPNAVINLSESVATKTDKSDLKTTTRKVGEKNIKVTVYTSGGNIFLLSDVDKVRLMFNRETGGFKFSQYTLDGTFYSNDYVNKIVVEKGTKENTIELSWLTGKVTIK